jgi:uncharacterized phage protein (TIGR01671 family)
VEIKIRAWNKELNEFVSLKECVIIIQKDNTLEITETSSWDMDFEPISEKVELTQYTGLKDINGVEIFTKDIVESNWGYRFDVQMDDGAFKTDSEDFEFINERNIRHYELKVIGNIYQNADLLDR